MEHTSSKLSFNLFSLIIDFRLKKTDDSKDLCKEGDWVLVEYDDQKYPGEVVETALENFKVCKFLITKPVK